MLGKAAALKLADVYATALLRASVEKKCLPGVVAAADYLQEVLSQHRVLVRVLKNLTIAPQQKLAALSDILGKAKQDHPQFMNFLSVLAERKRLPVVPYLLEAFIHRARAHEGVRTITAATAHPLGEKEQDHLRKTLEKQVGKQFTLDFDVRPELLGGLSLRIDAKLFDASLAGRVAALKRQLLLETQT